MSSEWKRFNKKDCPVCGGQRSDCRQSLNTKRVHCRHTTKADTLDEWKFIGEDGIGFGMWANQRDLEAKSKEQQEEWRRRQEAQRQQRLEAEAKRHAAALTEVERDREIRKLLNQLTLTPAHRQNLRDRGLTDEQVSLGMFRSVEPYQKLSAEINYRLAGVNLSGRSLTNNAPGFLCPIWNSSGLMVGWQLRLDVEHGGKYRWPTSANRARPAGPTVHLQNGELPLTICRPSAGSPTGIALDEGILKPWIHAQLSPDWVVVGAAGGNFAASKLQLKSALEQLSQELGTKTVTLFPDKASLQNHSVLRQYRTTYQILRGWGYEVRVAWWQQILKTDLDIDELFALKPTGQLFRKGDRVKSILNPELGIGEVNYFSEFSGKYQVYFGLDAEGAAQFVDVAVADAEPGIKFLSFPEFEKLQPNFFLDNLKEVFSKFKHKPAKPLSFRGFNFLPPAPQQQHLDYIPGQLPSFEEWQAQGSPKIIYGEGQRLQLWKEAVAQGWRYILDKSPPGLGKSYTAGLATPTRFGEECTGLFYFDKNHTNPSTASIEKNFADLKPRVRGWKFDRDRTTALGNPFKHRLKPEEPIESAEEAGNCYRETLFHVLREKNYQAEESSSSPICVSCPFNNDCGKKIGEGFGYRAERKAALKSETLRLHPNSAPSEEFDFDKWGGIWEEASVLINSVEVITLKRFSGGVANLDWEQTWRLIDERDPELHFFLQPLRTKIRELLLFGENHLKKWGLLDKAIRELLPEDELVGIPFPELMERVRTATMFKLEDFLADTLEGQVEEKAEWINANLGLNWLERFLKIWLLEQGSYRLDYDGLHLYSRASHHAYLVRHLKFNVFLDATVSVGRLATQLQLYPEEILVAEQRLTEMNNLKITQITGLGLLGKQRSESLKERVTVIKRELAKRHPEIVFLDWKNSEADGNWFADSRGQNRFEGAIALAAFGVPQPNLGEVAARYQVLTGRSVDLENPDPNFTEYYQEETKAEIEQAVGRLRAHRRPDEHLNFYFVGDYDLNWLGVPVQQVAAFDFVPEAGDRASQTRWKLLEAFKHLWTTGRKTTQEAIASLAGVGQARISQIAKQFGGWRTLKRTVETLLSGNSPPPDSDKNLWDLAGATGISAWFTTELEKVGGASEAIAGIGSLAKSFAAEDFEVLLGAMTPLAQTTLLKLLVQCLPYSWQKEMADTVWEF